MWLLWAAYGDKSGEPEFLGLYDSEDSIFAAIDLSRKTLPAMQLRIAVVPVVTTSYKLPPDAPPRERAKLSLNKIVRPT